jgi:hypothetical protein
MSFSSPAASRGIVFILVLPLALVLNVFEPA